MIDVGLLPGTVMRHAIRQRCSTNAYT